MRASAFPAYALAAGNLLFLLAVAAAVLGVIFVTLNLAGEDAPLRILFGDSFRGGVIITLLMFGQWALMAVLLAVAGLGLRLVAAFAEEIADGSATLAEALNRREPAE